MAEKEKPEDDTKARVKMWTGRFDETYKSDQREVFEQKRRVARFKADFIDLISTNGENAKNSGWLKLDKQASPTLYILAKLMLVVTEVAESAEAFRRGWDTPDPDIPEHTNHTVEMADVILRIMNIAYELGEADELVDCILKKSAHNQTRDIKKEGKAL